MYKLNSFSPALSLIRVNVFDEQASYAPYTCVQCDEAWCMNACPVNAIGVDPDTGAKGRARAAMYWLSPLYFSLSFWNSVHTA